jgi:hypothetical protein
VAENIITKSGDTDGEIFIIAEKPILAVLRVMNRNPL